MSNSNSTSKQQQRLLLSFPGTGTRGYIVPGYPYPVPGTRGYPAQEFRHFGSSDWSDWSRTTVRRPIRVTFIVHVTVSEASWY
eukprot:2156763-Rhodomonas_salina.2